MTDRTRPDEPILRIERAGAVAIVTLNEPGRMNCLSLPLRTQLREALREIDRDPDIRAGVLTGAGDNFCAGGDIASMGQTRDIASARRRLDEAGEIVRLLGMGTKPFVAAVEGWAAGAGLSLCMLCDTVVAAEHARFKSGFGGVGLIADMGLLHTLPCRIGVGRARTMLLYGEPVDAAAAYLWGLVDFAVPAGGALDEAMRRAEKLAAQAPLPVALTRAQLSAGLVQALSVERELQTLLFQSSDHAEGCVAFLEKRPAKFTGQ